MKKWESEKHKKWVLPAEGFKGHVAIDGSLLGKTGQWGASGWAVVQLDYDEVMGPLHGMYGSMEAELEVHRTIKRAELTQLLGTKRPKSALSVSFFLERRGSKEHPALCVSIDTKRYFLLEHSQPKRSEWWYVPTMFVGGDATRADAWLTKLSLFFFQLLAFVLVGSAWLMSVFPFVCDSSKVSPTNLGDMFLSCTQ